MSTRYAAVGMPGWSPSRNDQVQGVIDRGRALEDVRRAKLDVDLAREALRRNPADAWARERLEWALLRLQTAELDLC
jgi:hypothetical protein